MKVEPQESEIAELIHVAYDTFSSSGLRARNLILNRLVDAAGLLMEQGATLSSGHTKRGFKIVKLGEDPAV